MRSSADEREIDHLPPARAAVKRQLAWTESHPCSYVFLHARTGSSWTGDQQLRKTLFRPACIRAKVRYRYQLRHTFASMMLSAGEPIPWIAAKMSHSDPTVTQHADLRIDTGLNVYSSERSRWCASTGRSTPRSGRRRARSPRRSAAPQRRCANGSDRPSGTRACRRVCRANDRERPRALEPENGELRRTNVLFLLVGWWNLVPLFFGDPCACTAPFALDVHHRFMRNLTINPKFRFPTLAAV